MQIHVGKNCQGFPVGISKVSYPWISNRKIRDAFRMHSRDRFTRLPDLLVEQFSRYLANFPRLQSTEEASYEGKVTEYKISDVLKLVSLNKTQRHKCLPYEIYLRLSHMFMLILMDVFNHWFAKGAILGNATKGVITLLLKGNGHGQRRGRWL